MVYIMSLGCLLVLDAVGESLGWVGGVERGLAMRDDLDSSILLVFICYGMGGDVMTRMV